MHSHSIEKWEHKHAFLGDRHDRHERRTWLVVALTAVMMIAEIVGGALYGSMALVADGWHMSTHAGALAIAAFAYRFARKYAHDPRFTFGTGKLGELAGFASATILMIVALLIVYESAQRLYSPVPIHFNQAIGIAVAGLMVNLASAYLLKHHDHGHDDHGNGHHHEHGHDSNLRAAYLHVLADAVTSVLAIGGLIAARQYGWQWIDPAVGVLGGLVIASWSFSLLRSSGMILLDALPDRSLVEGIKTRLEIDTDRVSDLHLWRLGPGHTALLVSIVAHDPQDPAIYKERLKDLPGLSHVTVEVHHCHI